MTREEAINHIKWIKDYGHTENYLNEKETLDMAIKALTDIASISDALIDIGDTEGCEYGHRKEFDLAERWVDNEK